MCQSSLTPEPGANHAYFAHLAAQAGRIASLTVAANLVLTGDKLVSETTIHNIVLDLMDTAASIAADIAREADRLEAGQGA